MRIKRITNFISIISVAILMSGCSLFASHFSPSSENPITSQELETFNIKYTVFLGGTIEGETEQNISKNGNCSTVTAIANEGYRFSRWSDDSTNPIRTDTNINESFTYIAYFIKDSSKKVLFYENDNLIRTINVNDLSFNNLKSYIAYKTNYVFDKWQYIGVIGNSNDALYDYYVKLENGIAEDCDINLKAVFSLRENVDKIPFESYTIAHALGEYNGQKYVESKEAFLNSYEKGFRFFEVDVSYTSDLVPIICEGYGWGSNIPSSSDFLSKKTSTYTPLTLLDFFNLIEPYNDIYIDFDISPVISINKSYYDDYPSDINEFFQANLTP